MLQFSIWQKNIFLIRIPCNLTHGHLLVVIFADPGNFVSDVWSMLQKWFRKGETCTASISFHQEYKHTSYITIYVYSTWNLDYFANHVVLICAEILAIQHLQLWHLSAWTIPRRHRQAQGEETFSSLRCWRNTCHFCHFCWLFSFCWIFGGMQDILRITLLENVGQGKT